MVIPKCSSQKIHVLFFHPSIVNSSLDFYSVRDLPCGSSITLEQDQDLMKFFVERSREFNGKFTLGPMSAKQFQIYFSNVHTLISEQANNSWPCRSRSFALQALFLLDNLYSMGSYSTESFLGEIDLDFYPILVFLYQNYDQKLSVPDLTTKFNINRTTLAQMFQTNLGESFISYLNRLRVTMASSMLRDTMLPISEIMVRVGFHDNAHFLRTFKKYMGLSPSSYREKYCWM